MNCEIQWIDASGKATPDTNEAIGHVYREEYFAPPSRILPEGFGHKRTKDFPICAEHAKQLNRPGMEHWFFVPYVEGGAQ
jgi:hypothetical protein